MSVIQAIGQIIKLRTLELHTAESWSSTRLGHHRQLPLHEGGGVEQCGKPSRDPVKEPGEYLQRELGEA